MPRRLNPERVSRWLARGERQGWSWSELSRRSGLPAWKLRWWQRRLAVVRPRRGRRAFVAVKVVEPSSGSSRPLELVTESGLRVLVPADFDAGHLRRVLEALEPPC